MSGSGSSPIPGAFGAVPVTAGALLAGAGLLRGLSSMPVWVGGAAVGLAVYFTALAVKLMDDLLDEPEYASAMARGGAAAAYVALLLILAAGLAPGPAVSLFLVAYAVGMAPVPASRLPSGFPSWAESLAVTAYAAVVTGPVETMGSLLLVAAVQAFDDFWDYARDRAEGRNSIGLAIGRRPTLVLALVFYGGAVAFSAPKALAGLAAALALIVWAGTADGPGRLPELAWLGTKEPREAAVRRAARFRLAAAGVAATLFGAGAAALGEAEGTVGAVGPAGVAAVAAAAADGAGGSALGLPAWGLLALAVPAVVAATAGLVWAYRRGLGEGLERGRAAGKALEALRARAERLERRE